MLQQKITLWHNYHNVLCAVCNGNAPLKDPSGQLQKCTSSLTCPSGYKCNIKQYCCPTPG